MAERLQKILAAAGLGSRRKCEEWIKAGRVTVDGEVVAELGARADVSQNRITFDGRPLSRKPTRRHYVALHKPRGYACTLFDPHAQRTVAELVSLPGDPMLRPVGRLDLESEGLLFLSDDGEFINALTHPRFHVPKTYLATVRGTPDEAALRRLSTGVKIEDGKTVCADQVRNVKSFPATDTTDVEITIHQGRKRQVRQMFDVIDHKVLRLVRTRIGAITLGSLPAGAWRHLTPNEVSRLMSSYKEKTQDAAEGNNSDK
jgi:23S rRNA pseudouridine2605 synthase